MDLTAKLLYRFGAFELDAGERVLRRDGMPVPLPPKAYDVLLVLVQQCGHIVEKEALLKAAWPDAFVEEGNLPVNISVLRKVLGDDRHNGNRYIETVARRGYRFIAPVTEIGFEPSSAKDGEGNSDTTDRARKEPLDGPNGAANPGARAGFDHVLESGEAAVRQGRREAILQGAPALPESRRLSPVSRKRSWLVLAAIFAAVAAAGGAWLARPLPSPTVSNQRAITNDGLPKGHFATDGVRLYFTERTALGTVELKQVSVLGGDPSVMQSDLGDDTSLEIRPDHTALLLSSEIDPGAPIWLLPLPFGSRRLVGNLTGRDASWSPDGNMIVFCRGHEVWIAREDGSAPRKVVTLPGSVRGPRWSSDGLGLRFTLAVSTATRSADMIWEVSTNGSDLRPLFPEWKGGIGQNFGRWAADENYFVFAAESGGKWKIWATRAKGAGLHRYGEAPIKLIDGAQECTYPLPSPDGSKVLYLAATNQARLEHFSKVENEFVAYLNGISAKLVTYSPSGELIAYVRYPDETLWRMRKDGSDQRQLTFSPMRIKGLAWSPDSQTMAISVATESNPYKTYLVAADCAGEPRELRPGHNEMEGIPSWSSDGAKIAFGDVPEQFGHGTEENVIHILELRTRMTTVLRHSQGYWSSRWSPDGRYIAAVKDDDPDPYRQSLWLYDWQTNKWLDLGVDHVNDTVWSADGKYIYWDRERGEDGIFRLRVPTGRRELVAHTSQIRMAGGSWFGLDWNGSPMILHDTGTQEIYSVDVDWH